MKTFAELKKNLKGDASAFPEVKVALLGDSATQFLNVALRGAGIDYGLNLNVWEADFDQVRSQVFDPDSELYEFKPDLVVLFHASHKLLGRFNKRKSAEKATFARDEINLISALYQQIAAQLSVPVLFYDFPAVDDAVFGSFASKAPGSFPFQLLELNYELQKFAVQNTGFFLCQISSIQNQLGKPAMFQPAMYVNSDMVLSLDALPLVAAKTLDIVSALKGRFKKCVILDLDNTTWGGIIGDDGIENIQIGNLGIGKAFSEFQYWIKKLKERGIIVAVCSKNTESVAREPFEKHPDMVLRMDDIAVFVANWENKADNIRKIQNILNIGFDSMVFLDDNPFERNLVRENIPGICIPELPEDPADYLEYLYSLNLFETVSFSEEDEARTKQYQLEAARNNFQQSFTNESDYLKSLDMVSIVEPFNAFNTPRVAQLSQRSNQFNLRTVRYTEADVTRLGQSEAYATFSFTLSDKFGDNGLICVVVLQKSNSSALFIENWLMSCRVLKRGMEQFVLNTIMDYAKTNGFPEVIGEYIPTAKNEMVKDHYQKLGFTEHQGKWHMTTAVFVPGICHINTKTQHG